MTAGMIASSTDARIVSKEREAFIKDAISKRTIRGHVLEFGVGNGNSLRWITKAVGKTQTIYGFDSFEGLPEDWQHNDHIIFAKGSFKYDPPEPRNGVEIIEGWFEDTIAPWTKQHPGAISFLHIDADLYSSCKTVLTELNHQIVPGTILLFDELIEYARWEEGEWKAFTEWQEEYDREVFQLGTNWTQASYRVIR